MSEVAWKHQGVSHEKCHCFELGSGQGRTALCVNLSGSHKTALCKLAKEGSTTGISVTR
jgi:hypothetical protein